MRSFNERRVRIAKGLERCFKPLYPLVQRMLPAHKGGGDRRLLVFEPFLLGDFIMATAAFRFLRHHFPAARIDCVGPPQLAGLEAFFPWLDAIIPLRCPWSPQYRDYSYQTLRQVWRLAKALRKNSYDWAFDLRGDLRDILFLYATGAARRVGFGMTGAADFLTDVVPHEGQPYRHQVEGNLLVVSHPLSMPLQPAAFAPRMEIPEPTRAAAARWLEERALRDFIAVHPVASLSHKLWPVSSWAQLLDTVVLPKFPVVLFGTDAEAHIVDDITGRLRASDRVYRAQVPLPLFFGLTARARGMVCLDSAAAHVAAATGVPVVSLHGPGATALSRPYAPNARPVTLPDAAVPCRPCGKACTQPRNFCMQDLPLAMVVGALEDAGIV